VGILRDDAKESITMIEFHCETDFVAKTDQFKKSFNIILQSIHQQDSISNVRASFEDDSSS
jgi:translation elongation factor EF-Ts